MLSVIDAINLHIYQKLLTYLVVMIPELTTGFIALCAVKKEILSLFNHQTSFDLPVIVSCLLYEIYWMPCITFKYYPIIYISL